METIGERIQRLRKENNLTQEDVAKHLNISPQAISKWENDISLPDILLLTDIANLFHTSVDMLLGNEKKQQVKFIEPKERKQTKDLVIKIIVTSHNGDKVKINLPVPLLEVCLEGNVDILKVNNNHALKGIDLEKILSLVEQGVIGTLLEIESADGDFVLIIVE